MTVMNYCVYSLVFLVSLANAEEIFELLSSMRADDFVRFLPNTVGTEGLQHILVHHASIRPMGIVGRSHELAAFDHVHNVSCV